MSKSKSYDTLDEAYKELIGPLSRYAKSRLTESDYALDVVHDVFTKSHRYTLKHPEAKVNSFVLYREVARMCRRYNNDVIQPMLELTDQVVDQISIPEEFKGRVKPHFINDEENRGE